MAKPETSSPTHHDAPAVRIKFEQEWAHTKKSQSIWYFLQQDTTFLLAQSFPNAFSNLPKLLPAGDKF